MEKAFNFIKDTHYSVEELREFRDLDMEKDTLVFRNQDCRDFNEGPARYTPSDIILNFLPQGTFHISFYSNYDFKDAIRRFHLSEMTNSYLRDLIQLHEDGLLKKAILFQEDMDYPLHKLESVKKPQAEFYAAIVEKIKPEYVNLNIYTPEDGQAGFFRITQGLYFMEKADIQIALRNFDDKKIKSILNKDV